MAKNRKETVTTKTCCICGQEFTGWGNNPWPVVNDPESRCCDDCNYFYILPARIRNVQTERSQSNNTANNK